MGGDEGDGWRLKADLSRPIASAEGRRMEIMPGERNKFNTAPPERNGATCVANKASKCYDYSSAAAAAASTARLGPEKFRFSSGGWMMRLRKTQPAK